MDMIHAGQLIERILHDQGRSVTWFAAQLCCTRPNVYKIFHKENIDIQLLWRISCILNHDFFKRLVRYDQPHPSYEHCLQIGDIFVTLRTTCFPLLCSFHIPLRHINKTHRMMKMKKLILLIALILGCTLRATLKSLHFSFVTHNRVQVMQ